MKEPKKITKGHAEESSAMSTDAKVTSGVDKLAQGGRPRRTKKTPAQSSDSKGPYPYRYRTKFYQTKGALILGYLDAHKVFTGKVRPPNVEDFERDTGVQAGHGMYGARLHEYCHSPRTDKDGTHTIDRRALKVGKEGRVYQTASEGDATEGAATFAPSRALQQ
jgi:hypothetical protein